MSNAALQLSDIGIDRERSDRVIDIRTARGDENRGTRQASDVLGDRRSSEADAEMWLGTFTVQRNNALRGGGDEYDRLRTKHHQLAVKKVTQGLSSREAKDFDMVLWNLDRIEEARMGPDLDRLGAIVGAQENLARKIKDIVSTLHANSHLRRR